MSEDAALLSLVGELYDAALDEARWAALAPHVAVAFEAESCVLQVRAGNSVELLSATENFVPKFLQEYIDHYYQFDEWVNLAAPLPTDVARIGHELISLDELKSTAFYDMLCKLETPHLVGALITVDTAAMGSIGVHRKSADFDAVSKRRMQILIPHLRRALQVRRELGKQRLIAKTALEGLERLATATLLVDAGGRILFANSGALGLLAEGDGLREKGGHLEAGTPRSTACLRALIAGAALAGTGNGIESGGGVQLPRRASRPLTALVCPTRPESYALVPPRRLVIVFVRDPERQGASQAATLQSLYRLTAAEARLAAALADGKTVEEFAGDQGISPLTARTALKRVMKKTDTNRQGELIGLILRSAAALTRVNDDAE